MFLTYFKLVFNFITLNPCCFFIVQWVDTRIFIPTGWVHSVLYFCQLIWVFISILLFGIVIFWWTFLSCHYSEIIMSVVASQNTGISSVCSTVCSGTDQRKHQSSMSLAFMRGIHWSWVDSPHKGPVTWKMLPFDDMLKWLYYDMFICLDGSD